VRSLYIPIFHIPGLQAGMTKIQKRLPSSAWGQSIARREGARVDEEWPGPTFGADAANGMQLYRANVIPRMRNPRPQTARVPVQLIVPVKDPWVPPSLLAGIEDMAPDLRRRNVDAGHWVVRSQPVDVAVWITEFIESLDEAAA
jgi:pimeloyl-ACP methyl ester carboxylesterase